MIKLWPRLQQTLQTQLTLRLMIIAALSTTISSLVFSVYEYNNAENADTLRLQTIAEILAPNLTASVLFNDKETANELIRPLNEQSNIIEVNVYDHQGTLFLSQTKQTDTQFSSSAPQLKRISVKLTIDNIHHGELVILSDNSLIEQHVKFFISFISLMLGTTLFISFAVSVAVSRRFTTPIIKLADTAHRITTTSNYGLRAENTRQDEIGELTQCFNLMLATIEQRDQTLELQVSKRTKQLKVANLQLKEQAYKDSLSGFPNRRYLLELMSELINNVDKRPFTIMFIDLDGFKEVNDTMGHDAGDLLITSAANRIQHIMRQQDTLARIGGDEFTLLLNGLNDIPSIAAMAEKVRSALTEPFHISSEDVTVTASIGICSYPDSGSSVESIMKKADLAMYAAKDAGRNCFRFFEQPMLDTMQLKRRMLNDLRLALENKEFALFFQPIINIHNGRIEKAEALLRWIHPEKGVIPPSEFIPYAEESGLINDIGCWVTSEAINTIKLLRESYAPNFTITLNASPVQFKKDSVWFNDFVEKLAHAKLGDHAIAIEITENTLMENHQWILDKFTQLNNMGVEIAIDDFGVGYSSLSYLQKLAVDIIKIDRSFVIQIDHDPASNTLCRTMIEMAQNLNMKVVAEGVETQHQLNRLIQYGCLYGQGNFFSRPLSSTRFQALLATKVSFHSVQNQSLPQCEPQNCDTTAHGVVS
jgi:diguanylate cyclase (GGDEF)-like protein